MRAFQIRLTFLLFLCVAIVPLSGCLFRTRKIERQYSNAPLKTATQQELIDFINSQARQLKSLQATVDIDASAGDEKNGKVTDYKEIRGYILARKPGMLRMIGQMPVVRNTAFDMVSNGQEFKLWIPPRNKFVVGNNANDSYNPQQRLENLRPQNIYNAILLHEIGPDEIAVMENGFETVLDEKRHRVEQPDYELAVIARGQNGWYLARKIQVSRTDLLPHRQQIYDQQGNLIIDAQYQNYIDQGEIRFPKTIEVEMPREDYDITLKVLKLELNKALTDEQFALEQPSGAEVVRVGQASIAPTKSGDGHAK
jgi:outer membrane lipoprotein-sorting protein